MADSLGKFLKGEREKRNIPLERISALTKIKKEYLLALEEDRHDRLPAPLYVKGYLRSYARSLSLDEKEVLTRFENYWKSLHPPEPQTFQEATPTEAKKSKRLFLQAAALAIFFLLAIVFALFLSSNHTAEEKSPSSSQGFSVIPATIPPTAVPQEDNPQAFDILPRMEGDLLNSVKTGTPPATLFEIVEAALGTEIERKNDYLSLKGRVSEFTSNHQRGFFFTRLRSSTHGKITHVWLYEGKEYHRLEMEIRPPTWSVFSYLTFRPQHVGDWTVEARDGDLVLARLPFKVLP